jgi:hypothetical protein
MAATGVGLLAMPASAGPSAPAQAGRPPQPVQVTNSAAEPVPVAQQGAVSVQGTVGLAPGQAVAATQSGPWAVGIEGTPTVQVGNSADAPVPVQVVNQPGGSPEQALFQRQVQVSIQGGSRCATVPWSVAAEGERAVITNASVQARPPAGQGLEVFLQVLETGTGFGTNIYFPLQPAAHSTIDGRDVYWATIETQAVADGPNSVFLWACLSETYDAPSTNSIGVLTASVSGHLVPSPG